MVYTARQEARTINLTCVLESHQVTVAVTKFVSLFVLGGCKTATRKLLEQAESPPTMSSRCVTPKECNYVTTTNKTNNKANQHGQPTVR